MRINRHGGAITNLPTCKVRLTERQASFHAPTTALAKHAVTGSGDYLCTLMKQNPDQGRRGGARKGSARPTPGQGKPKLKFAPVPDASATMRLNRYIAQSGVCSRREADVMIGAGVVSVNNQVVTKLGFKVDPTKDLVRVEGDTIRPETMRYVLINKPKNFLGVEHDPSGRRCVGDLIKHACKERISPVDRIEKESTGLILFTNDGELAKRLNHPKVALRELYHITLRKRPRQKTSKKWSKALLSTRGLSRPKRLCLSKTTRTKLAWSCTATEAASSDACGSSLGTK